MKVLSKYNKGKCVSILESMMPSILTFATILVLTTISIPYMMEVKPYYRVLLVPFYSANALLIIRVLPFFSNTIYGIFNNGKPFLYIDNDHIVVSGVFRRRFNISDIRKILIKDQSSTKFLNAPIELILLSGSSSIIHTDLSDTSVRATVELIEKQIPALFQN